MHWDNATKKDCRPYSSYRGQFMCSSTDSNRLIFSLFYREGVRPKVQRLFQRCTYVWEIKTCQVREISAAAASDFCFLNEVASHMEKGLLKSRYSCP